VGADKKQAVNWVTVPARSPRGFRQARQPPGGAVPGCAGGRRRVNAANPGYCATDLNGNSGFRTAEQGAEVSVHLATLPADGPSGVLWGYLWTTDGTESFGILPW